MLISGLLILVYKLSTRPEKRIGLMKFGIIAEQALANALNKAGVEWHYSPGEGGFYAPKIEFSLQDCLGGSLAMWYNASRFFLGRALGGLLYC